jgi:uncharacterized protein (DUF1501 family)
MPTADLRSIFKGILSEHLSLPDHLLEDSVFPNSSGAPAVRDIIRS